MSAGRDTIRWRLLLARHMQPAGAIELTTKDRQAVASWSCRIYQEEFRHSGIICIKTIYIYNLRVPSEGIEHFLCVARWWRIWTPGMMLDRSLRPFSVHPGNSHLNSHHRHFKSNYDNCEICHNYRAFICFEEISYALCRKWSDVTGKKFYHYIKVRDKQSPISLSCNFHKFLLMVK